MARPIDADKLIQHFYEKEYADMYYIEVVKRIIEDQPTLSPDGVRGVGKWIDMGDFEQCSVCKGTHLKEFNSMYGKATWIKTPYCHNCGARMKGAEDETTDNP